MAATASQFYFQFRFPWFRSFWKVEIYLHTKFRRDISIHGWDYKYLRFLKNKRPPFWNSTSGSNIYACVTMGMTFCICVPNFVQIGPSATELWHHTHFSRWRPSAILNYFKVTADHPRSANGGPGRSLNFDSIRFIISEIMLFCVMRFWLEFAYLHGCTRCACAEWGVNLLLG